MPARRADIPDRRTLWVGRSVSARPPADERESPEDQKPDEQREQPSFIPSKQDPFYLGLREDIRKARRTARRNIDNASRRRRRAADPDHRDKCCAQRHGLSLQDYRAMRERQKNVCGICKTPGKPLCVDHCHATGKVRGLLCRDCNLGLGNYKDNPVFTRAATAYLEASRRDDGNRQGADGEALDSISRSRVQQEPAPNAGESPESRNTAAVFVDLELQIHRTGGGGGKSQGNLQENSGPATCPLQACRPNCS
jgi:Recombination endonuclease VII